MRAVSSAMPNGLPIWWSAPRSSLHDVVMQNQTTGAVDFLQFNGTQLVGSFMTSQSFAPPTLGVIAVNTGDGLLSSTAAHDHRNQRPFVCRLVCKIGARLKAGISLYRWRMGWDSNPREACTPAGFQDRCLKPLGHPSNLLIYIQFYRFRHQHTRRRYPNCYRISIRLAHFSAPERRIDDEPAAGGIGWQRRRVARREG
jgi:hypothetical protein